MRIARTIASAWLAVGALWFTSQPISAQDGVTGIARMAASTPSAIREWDGVVEQMARSGQLRPRVRRADTLLPNREHERFDQYFQGARVFGADVARQTENGVTISLFGTLYQNISVDTTPQLSEDDARTAIAERAGALLPDNIMPELVILPRESGGYALAYRARVFADGMPTVYFIDAKSGELLLEYSDLQTQASRGIGTGVLGDAKKLSTWKDGSTFRASDELRPPALLTFDLRGNLNRAMSFLSGVTTLVKTDLATDADDNWSDPASVDAHAYAGWVYDFYFKRFGRRGLDNNDITVANIVHAANRQDVFRQPASIVGLFYMNAAYLGGGVMLYGEGLPNGVTDTSGRSWNYLSGGLDVIAHELTHGVTEFSSRLIYRNESGALNEAFSDMMGVSAEFFHQPPGSGPLQADYLMGEDVIAPGGLRSLENPSVFGDPDHYSRRYRGTSDNGGVHTNSTVATHAFYLAIEGGANRTSGFSVNGVGSANRDQIEKVVYRAFTQLMPSNANFSTGRAVTIQSARDLYGSGSSAERAVTEAWTAVGVQ